MITQASECADARAVAVYCAASPHIDESYFEMARTVGAELARHGAAVVNGGGAMGLMGAVNDGALAAGGVAVGVIPQFMYDNGWQHRGLTRLEVVGSMHERKARIAQLTTGAIALPGGVGTLEELLEIITWRKLALYQGNVVVLNYRGFYDPLLSMIERCHTEGFIQRSTTPLYTVVDSVEAAIAAALASPSPATLVSPYDDAAR